MMKSILKHRSKLSLLLFTLSISFLGCEEFVEIDPPRTEIVADELFESNSGATSAIHGIYSGIVELSSDNLFNAGLEIYTGLYSDELIDIGGEVSRIEFASASINTLNEELYPVFWLKTFSIINSANAIVEGLRSSSLNTVVRDQVLGEALLVRALGYFYMTNLFGEVPLVLTTDVATNERIGKFGVHVIYDQIEADLLEAQSLLAEDFIFTANDYRERPTVAAASTLLARLYLYRGDWANAESQATAVIDQSDLFELSTDVNDVFLPGSKEAIWNFVPEPDGNETRVGRVFVLPSFAPIAWITNALRPEYTSSFEVGDLRSENWIDTLTNVNGTFLYPVKYKQGFGGLNFDNPPELYAVFRLAELYLIRAEARAQQNNISGSLEDINLVRARAGLAAIAAGDQSTLLEAIYLERKHELFVEWGHRWLDLKRTGRAAAVMSALPGKDWQETDLLWPLPEQELLINPNLLPQNAGY